MPFPLFLLISYSSGAAILIFCYAIRDRTAIAVSLALAGAFGLTDEVIAHTGVDDFGEGLPGHERHNADYVLDEVRPEIIITGDAVDDPLDSDAFWRFYGKAGGLPAKDAIMADPRLPGLYEVRSVQIEGHWFNFLQRTDTLADFQASGLR